MENEDKINAYLKCDPIKGNSKDKDHNEWIEVLNFSHGVSQPTQGASGKGGISAGRAQFTPFRIKKFVDNSSVDVNMFCAKGTQIAKVEIEACRILQGENICYLKYELDKVMIQSVSIEAGDTVLPVEIVEFVYSAISWTFTPVEDGRSGTTIGPKKWNLENNQAE